MGRQDIQVLRDLALQVAELAALPMMEARRRHWTAVHDLSTMEPTVLVEVGPIEGFVAEQDMVCTEGEAQNLEYYLRQVIRHAAIGDDYVVDDHFSISWQVEDDGFGVPVTKLHSDGLGFAYAHPITTPDSLSQLNSRTFHVNREATFARKAQLTELLGDSLPVRINFGMYPVGFTHDAYRLIGNDNLMFWCFDEPDSLHFLVDYLRKDRHRMLDELLSADALCTNHSFNFVGSGSPGYVTDLPADGFSGYARVCDLWCWLESQETTAFSPSLFSEFFLGPMADIANRFGLTYYGCCERVDDRIQAILDAIPNVRSISASPWTDVENLCRQTGPRHVISRKPSASFLSASTARWEAVEAETEATVSACRRYNCPSEYIFRDLYTVGGDFSKLTRWVETVRRIASR